MPNLQELQAEESVLQQISSAEGDGPGSEMHAYMTSELTNFHEKVLVPASSNSHTARVQPASGVRAYIIAMQCSHWEDFLASGCAARG